MKQDVFVKHWCPWGQHIDPAQRAFDVTEVWITLGLTYSPSFITISACLSKHKYCTLSKLKILHYIYKRDEITNRRTIQLLDVFDEPYIVLSAYRVDQNKVAWKLKASPGCGCYKQEHFWKCKCKSKFRVKQSILLANKRPKLAHTHVLKTWLFSLGEIFTKMLARYFTWG